MKTLKSYLVLTMVLALLAGLAARAELRHDTAPAAPVTAPPSSPRQPPWAASGFRDDEGCDLAGEPLECR